MALLALLPLPASIYMPTPAEMGVEAAWPVQAPRGWPQPLANPAVCSLPLPCLPATLAAAAPCTNVIASHPAVISVAATDTYDQATAFGPTDSPCISLWAPGGGLGNNLIGAHPSGSSKYTSSVSR
jgi:hypothetical protein